MMVVNILGTDYVIHFVDEFPEYRKEVGEGADGLCNRHDRDIFIKRCNDNCISSSVFPKNRKEKFPTLGMGYSHISAGNIFI